MALFQPIQPGPAGSAVTPKAEVQDNIITNTLDVVAKAGVGLAGVFQQQTEAKQKYAGSVALTAYVEEQSKIADAVEQGLDPGIAATRARAIFNKHAANNPLLLDEFMKVNKAYGDSQMGIDIIKGNRDFQAKQAFAKEQQTKAAADGFNDVPTWQAWEAQNRAWAEKNQRDNEELAKLRMEATRASTDASRRSAALSAAREKEIDNKLANNQGLRSSMVGWISGTQDGLEKIYQMPSTNEQKFSMVQRFIGQRKADLAAAFPNADQSNITMMNTQLDGLQAYIEDAITQGKTTTALKNKLEYLTKDRALAMTGDDQVLNMMAMTDVMGPSWMSLFPMASTETLGKLLKFSAPQSQDKPTTPPQLDEGGFAALDQHFKNMSKATDPINPAQQQPSKLEIVESNIVNTLKSVTLYGNGYASKEEVEASSKAIYGGGYDMLKSVGKVTIPPELQKKSSELLARNYEGVFADIKNDYLDATTTVMRSGASKTETLQSTEVIDFVVENGRVKFVAKIPEAQAEAERLNRSYGPAITNLTKMAAVMLGDPDMERASKEIIPRLIEQTIPEPTQPKAAAPTEQSLGYGKRADGTEKGAGYFGEIKRPDGDVSTELSIGVDYGTGEKEIPMLVPTLTKAEIDHLINGGEPTEEIVSKAVAHAAKREKEGKPVFAQPGEKFPLPKSAAEVNKQAKDEGVDLSQYEDGTYEDANGNTVVIKGGKVVE